MTKVFWQELQKELKAGITTKNHPFRYGTLGTVGLDKMARLRTIVLRNIGTPPDLEFTFYTDQRSKKITHIKENPKVSLLFYHPNKLLQLKIEGTARIINDEQKLNDHWKKIGPKSRKDYITKTAPGTALKNPDQLEYLDESHHFCMVQIAPYKIEYLKLKRPHHLRVRFSKEEEDWYGEFLVP
jgi:pyridoxine/pyridoxamine 5'-phosphate oxidase